MGPPLYFFVQYQLMLALNLFVSGSNLEDVPLDLKSSNTEFTTPNSAQV